MIVLFTDFGWEGPYVGQLKAALIRDGSGLPIVDLMHDAPAFNPRASAYLLAALVEEFPLGTVFLGVVDPGVGDPQRRPAVVHADGRWFVGEAAGVQDFLYGLGNRLALRKFVDAARLAKTTSSRQLRGTDCNGKILG